MLLYLLGIQIPESCFYLINKQSFRNIHLTPNFGGSTAIRLFDNLKDFSSPNLIAKNLKLSFNESNFNFFIMSVIYVEDNYVINFIHFFAPTYLHDYIITKKWVCQVYSYLILSSHLHSCQTSGVIISSDKP